MDALLKPDFGLIFWTVVNFLVLVFLLAKLAWKPVTAMLDEREQKIAADIAGAKQANEDAQKIKQGLQEQLDNIAKQSLQKLKEAQDLGEHEKMKILSAAQEQAQGLIDAAQQQIKADTAKLMQQLKKEFIDTTMLALSKIIAKQADAETNRQMVEDFIKDLKEAKGNKSK